MPHRPLAGIRVLDLTNVLAGPYCTYQLAAARRRGDQGRGARPRRSGPPPRPRPGAQPGRPRRLVPGPERRQEVGRARPQGRRPTGRRSRRLVRDADVLRRELPRRRAGPAGLRLGRRCASSTRAWSTARSRGFGQTGPMSDAPAYDQIIQGLSGMMSITGTPDTAPLRVGFPVCDTVGGLTAAFAICAALARPRSAPARAASSTCPCWRPRSPPWAGRSPTTWSAASTRSRWATRTPPPRRPARSTTADGPLNIAANRQEQFETLCRLVGRRTS